MNKFFIVPSNPDGSDVEKEVVVHLWQITLKAKHDETYWMSIVADKPVGSSSNQIRITKKMYAYLKTQMQAIDLTYIDNKPKKGRKVNAKPVRQHGTAGRNNRG